MSQFIKYTNKSYKACRLSNETETEIIKVKLKVYGNIHKTKTETSKK